MLALVSLFLNYKFLLGITWLPQDSLYSWLVRMNPWGLRPLHPGVAHSFPSGGNLICTAVFSFLMQLVIGTVPETMLSVWETPWPYWILSYVLGNNCTCYPWNIEKLPLNIHGVDWDSYWSPKGTSFLPPLYPVNQSCEPHLLCTVGDNDLRFPMLALSSSSPASIPLWRAGATRATLPCFAVYLFTFSVIYGATTQKVLRKKS